MDVSVFSAFENAVVSGVWQIGKVQRGTEVGTTVSQKTSLDIIVDDASSANLNQSPSADGLKTQTLIYVKPGQLPTLETAEICAGYLMIKNNSRFFSITDCSLAKNQHTGKLEHVELLIEETEAL